MSAETDALASPVTFEDMIACSEWVGLRPITLPPTVRECVQWWTKRSNRCESADGAGVTKSATTQDVTGSASARPSAYGVNDVASPSAPNSGPSAGGTGSGAISVADAVEKLRAAINDDRLFRNGSVTSDHWDAIQRIEIAVRTLLWLDVPAVLKAANDRADSLADSMIYEKRRADLYWGDTNSLRADLNAAHTECDSLRARLSEAVGLLRQSHGPRGLSLSAQMNREAFLAREKETEKCQTQNGASASTANAITSQATGASRVSTSEISVAGRNVNATPSNPPPPPAPAGTGAQPAESTADGLTKTASGTKTTIAKTSTTTAAIPSAPIRGEPSVVTAARERKYGDLVRDLRTALRWIGHADECRQHEDGPGTCTCGADEALESGRTAIDALAEQLRVEREEADMMAVIVNADSDDNVCGVCGGTGPNQSNAFLVRQWKRRYRARRAGEGRK